MGHLVEPVSVESGVSYFYGDVFHRSGKQRISKQASENAANYFSVNRQELFSGTKL